MHNICKQTPCTITSHLINFPFTGIDELMQRDIDAALRPYPADDVLVDAFRIQLKRQDMATLSRLNWLNDAVRV